MCICMKIINLDFTEDFSGSDHAKYPRLSLMDHVSLTPYASLNIKR